MLFILFPSFELAFILLPYEEERRQRRRKKRKGKKKRERDRKGETQICG